MRRIGLSISIVVSLLLASTGVAATEPLIAEPRMVGDLEAGKLYVEDATVVDEWCNENSLNQEYDVQVRIDGKLERHRVLGILVVAGDRLSGERIYGSERALRLMLGDLYDELEPL